MAENQSHTDLLWRQDHYVIKRKVFRIVDQYWIEDQEGNKLAYSKQKFWRIKEDIRIFTDESMTQELFRIEQAQIIDIWGKFDVTDSGTNTPLGYFRRKGLKSEIIADKWEIYTMDGQMIGQVTEGLGRGLARKYLPGGALIPEKVTVELDGKPVAQINQKFKILGDTWDLQCQSLPDHFDRRVLIACVILMAMIERQRK